MLLLSLAPLVTRLLFFQATPPDEALDFDNLLTLWAQTRGHTMYRKRAVSQSGLPDDSTPPPPSSPPASSDDIIQMQPATLTLSILCTLSLPAPLPTGPFDFTVRCIKLTEPLARVGGHQQGELTQSWQLCGSNVQLVVLRALYRD